VKAVFLIAIGLLISGCALTAPSAPQVFRIGELEVRLYKDQAGLAKELPPVLAAVQALSIGGQQVQVLGYFDKQNKRIHSLDDTRVLLHELKHYFEPEWEHRVGCVAVDETAPAGCDVKRHTETAATEAREHGFELLTEPPL
jgi:hypothetical protein